MDIKKNLYIQLIAFVCFLLLFVLIIVIEKNTGFFEEYLFDLSGWSVSKFMNLLLEG
jgi:hypothetical protein